MDRPPKTREPLARVPRNVLGADLRAVAPVAIMPVEKLFYYSLRINMKRIMCHL